ncbi:hypothetical protein QTP86_005294 [Hemibagrus guttatus]|nr:hypothetical protein QTP86_005294 [Hemibagrus guttatus]
MALRDVNSLETGPPAALNTGMRITGTAVALGTGLVLKKVLVNIFKILQTYQLRKEMVMNTRNGARFYHRLLCEPKPPSITGPTKPNLHSHKQLTDTLQLKQSNASQLTSPTWCQNSPGFFYQISHQWLSQYSLRLQNHQGKKDLL